MYRLFKAVHAVATNISPCMPLITFRFLGSSFCFEASAAGLIPRNLNSFGHVGCSIQAFLALCEPIVGEQAHSTDSVVAYLLACSGFGTSDFPRGVVSAQLAEDAPP